MRGYQKEARKYPELGSLCIPALTDFLPQNQ
jgi:hypothetical protein